MEDNSKSPESDFSGNIAGEISTLLAVSDDEDGSEWLSEVPIKEERVEELMQELLKEMNTSSPSSSSPDNSPGLFPSFDSVGGNKESCGPSLSDSASTWMAGLEGHVAGGFGLHGVAGAGDGSPAVEGGGRGKFWGERMDGCDGKEGDDEWLTRVLSCGPQDMDAWI
ncbi:SH3 and multiple ankyrin repeat domains protein like [Actinidia chinensis var. chinensis]|uniref:SH3 and multiple ankyrin repeat domains protein like n=1 Tax=Actinidia chinensis var. chinensis TaxID=1590841 RepID=A0A2R6PHG0_ACTCC|nr:SH3 and multiple ankyrin repeat domains protein like [Actinidia chinensis var. chinensis]PSR91313.1 SH3 and multiple ankyrin repeat domains protein like [Actinidia chinensis var. chinensis]